MATKWYRAKENQPALIGAGGAIVVALITGLFLLINGYSYKAKPEPEKFNQSSNSPTITGSQNSITYSQQNDNHSQNFNNYNVNVSAALLVGLPTTAFFVIFGGIIFYHKITSARVTVNASMPLKEDENGRRILVEVAAVNSGRRPCHVKSVALFLQPTTLHIPGRKDMKLESSSDEEDNLSNPPASQLGVVELKADGGPKTWTFPYKRNPSLRVYEEDGERYGSGRIELTTGQKIRFKFLMIPDSSWDVLNAPVAPVFDNKGGYRCSNCGMVFLVDLNAKTVKCPQCHYEFNLKPKTRQTAKTVAATEAIRNAYLPIINTYEDCTVLIEENAEEKLRVRQEQFQVKVNWFWKIYEANNVHLPTDAVNDIRVAVNTCISHVRLCDNLQKLRDSKPGTQHGLDSDLKMCQDIEKAEQEIIALRPKVDNHFRNLLNG